MQILYSRDSRDNWRERLLSGLWLSRAGRADCTRTREKPHWNRITFHKQNKQVSNCNYSFRAHPVPGRGLAQEDGIPNGSQCLEQRALAACQMSYTIQNMKYALPYVCEYLNCTIIGCVNRHIRLHIRKSQHVVNKYDKIANVCM